MEPTTSEDALKIFEMTTKALKYSINLFDKAVVGFERLDYNFERSSTLGKYNQTALHATEKSFMEGKVNWCDKLHCCPFIRNCPSHISIQQPPPWSVSSHQHPGQEPPSSGSIEQKINVRTPGILSILKQILFSHLSNVVDCQFKMDKIILSDCFINQIRKLSSYLAKPYNELWA